MPERISHELLAAVANTVADGGLDFDVVCNTLSTFCAMNIAAFAYENELCIADFPTPQELVDSVDFERREADVERRVAPSMFARLRRALISERDGRDFAMANIDEVLDAMRDVVLEMEREIHVLDTMFELPAFDPGDAPEAR
tara:strand:- start:2440 stop:2865 length:426 start_codon:yes stop_codon:yes gene_type:complete